MSNMLKILLIEDDVIEVMKMQRVISTHKLYHQIVEVNNGEEALDFLSKVEVLPDIILLDLNMPKINGIEFLEALKKDEKIWHIPTIILTTSNNQKDLKSCYNLGVAGYVLKPLKYEEYTNKILSLLSYWSSNELIKR